MKQFIFLLFLLACTYTQAQTPGYMGSRFNAGYGIHTGPMILDEAGNGNFKSARYDGFGLNILHEGFVEFAVLKRMSVGISAKFYKTSYFKNSYYTEKIYYGITGQNFTVYGKLFYPRYVAPWGRYMIFGPTIRQFTAKYDKNIYTNDPVNGVPDPTYDYGPTKQSFRNFDIVFGTGRTRIIADRISIDYGYTVNVFSLFATALDIDGANLTSLFSSSNAYGEEIGQTSRWRVRGVNRINVFLRVGVIF